MLVSVVFIEAPTQIHEDVLHRTRKGYELTSKDGSKSAIPIHKAWLQIKWNANFAFLMIDNLVSSAFPMHLVNVL